MTPLADRSTGEQWPELEACACGGFASPCRQDAYADEAISVPLHWVLSCYDGCFRTVYALSVAEAAVAWNAMQREAGARKVADLVSGYGS